MALYLTTPHPESLPTHELGFSDAQSLEVQVQATAQHWLTQVEVACRSRDSKLFRSLFSIDGIWRDIMAFTADYRSIRAVNIEQAAKVGCLCFFREFCIKLLISAQTSGSSRSRRS